MSNGSDARERLVRAVRELLEANLRGEVSILPVTTNSAAENRRRYAYRDELISAYDACVEDS